MDPNHPVSPTAASFLWWSKLARAGNKLLNHLPSLKGPSGSLLLGSRSFGLNESVLKRDSSPDSPFPLTSCWLFGFYFPSFGDICLWYFCCYLNTTGGECSFKNAWASSLSRNIVPIALINRLSGVFTGAAFQVVIATKWSQWGLSIIQQVLQN